jgi:hypothetical protein
MDQQPLVCNCPKCPDPYLTACDVFTEFADYREYVLKNGCNFGKFTCCPGTNSTFLNEFALEECGIADPCPSMGDEEIWLLFLIFFMGVSFLIFLCWTLRYITTRTHMQYTRLV